MDVEQGKRQDQAVLGRPSPGLDHAAALGQQVAVIEQRPLRFSCRTRGIEQQSRTLGIQRPATTLTLPHKGGGM